MVDSSVLIINNAYKCIFGKNDENWGDLKTHTWAPLTGDETKTFVFMFSQNFV